MGFRLTLFSLKNKSSRTLDKMSRKLEMKGVSANQATFLLKCKCVKYSLVQKLIRKLIAYYHGLQSLPPSPKRAERKGRRRPFREAGSGHKQWNTVSCVDTFSIISKFSAQNWKI